MSSRHNIAITFINPGLLLLPALGLYMKELPCGHKTVLLPSEYWQQKYSGI